MTVCIAAICNNMDGTDAIVVACDHMLSLESFSADNLTSKVDPIHRDWSAMFSGEVSNVVPVLERAREILFVDSNCPVPLARVTSAFTEAYKEQLRVVCESTVLAPFGLDLNTFTEDGHSRFGPDAFATMFHEIRSTSLGCEFLVFGFTADGDAHIFTVSNPGQVTVHDLTGFWAIGSGQQSALSSLFSHRYNRLHGVVPAIYHACEAKFMAESATGVGHLTLLQVSGFGKPRGYLYEHNIDDIRSRWEAEGKAKQPKGILSEIEEMIELAKRSQNSP